MAAAPGVAATAVLILRRHISNMNSASNDVPHMVIAIGVAVCVLYKLTTVEASAPIPIWVAPISEEALPAFLLNGASDNAEVLGLIKPRQQRYMNSNAMIPGNDRKLFQAHMIKTSPVIV